MQQHRVRIWFGFFCPSGGFHFHDFCFTPFRCLPLSLQTSFVANTNSAAFGVKRLMRGKKKTLNDLEMIWIGLQQQQQQQRKL
jgi:hypothetical protein